MNYVIIVIININLNLFRLPLRDQSIHLDIMSLVYGTCCSLKKASLPKIYIGVGSDIRFNQTLRKMWIKRKIGSEN